MEIRCYKSGSELFAAVGPMLTTRESEHSLLLGFAQSERPFIGCELALAAFHGNEPQAALLQTSINEAILSRADIAAAEALGRALAESSPTSLGLVGPASASDAAAGAFAARAGVALRLERQLLLYALAAEPRAGVGTTISSIFRPAERGEASMLIGWVEGFERDTRTPAHTCRAEERVQQGLASGRLFVLEAAGQLVAMASWSRPTANTKTINCVYTPPEHRGRGYGRAVTVRLTTHLLALGTRDILLFTDADDPTPNRLYRRVGFEPTAAFTHWAFV